MKRLAAIAAMAWMAGSHAAFGQAGDVNRILADARAAMGGEKRLAAVRTVEATGQSVRVSEDRSSAPVDVAIAWELPDKFMKTDPVAVINGAAITRTSGFNGATVIDIVDRPPSIGGNVVVRFGGPGEEDGRPQSPEQQEAQRKAKLTAARQEFARLVLGVLVSSPAAYPLEFAYGGQAESPDGKADIVDVKGEGDFQVRLFIDAKSHLPLMLSWMGRAPMIIKRTIGGPGGPLSAAPKMTPEQIERMAADARAAEARQPPVEYRLYYGDYRDVDGVKFPFSLQRSIDGKPAEQVTFEKVKINGKIDPKKFETK